MRERWFRVRFGFVARALLGGAALVVVAAGCPEGRTPAPAASRAIVERETMALVTIEGLGRLGLGGLPADAVPVLRSLAGTAGRPVYTSCPSVVPALASVMSGLLPSGHGVLDNSTGRVPGDLPLLAEQLQRKGWRTAAFVANPLLSRVTGLERGFEVFDGAGASVLGPARYHPEVRAAGQVGANALQWLAGRAATERVFLWVHLSDLGEPRIEGRTGPPAGARERLDGIDRTLGRLREALRNAGNRGILIVAGDRGVLVGPNGEDLGQGFFLEPESLAVYYAEETFGGFPAQPEARPQSLRDVHARILAASEARKAAASDASVAIPESGSASAPVVVTESAIPWTWWRWPAAVAVVSADVLYIHDGTWRRSEGAAPAVPLRPDDVPAGVRDLARGSAARLEAIPAPGPRRLALDAALRAARIQVGDEAARASVPAPHERRRIVAKLHSARLLGALGDLGRAREMLEPLASGATPQLAAALDALMLDALASPDASKPWALAQRVLRRFGPLPVAVHWTAHAALRRDDPALAEVLIDAYLERVPQDADALYDRACIRSLRGDLAGAEAMLRAAADAGFHEWDLAEVDPDLRNLRADARYAALRKSLGR